MNIGSLSDFNSIWKNMPAPVSNLPVADAESIKPNLESLAKVDKEENAINLGSLDEEQTSAYSNKKVKNTALEDISITFNNKDDFGTIGRDSDIHTLDMEKAISSMKKDQLLKQYQYFVGDTKTVEFADLKGSVTVK